LDRKKLRKNYKIDNIISLISEINKIIECKINLKDSIIILLSKHSKEKSLDLPNKFVKVKDSYF